MAGFEVVVRPVVFPDIRPAPAQPVPPADDPDKGFAVIRGNGAKQIDLTNSYSASTSSSQRTEIKRRVDVARVYQKKDDGTVNEENFVDIEAANKIWMGGGSEPQVIDTGTTDTGFAGTERKPLGKRVDVQRYSPIEETDNIKIRRRNIMRQPGTTAPGYAGTD